MPQFFAESLDDEPVPDQCLTFAGGMFSNAKPRMLKPEQAALLTDVEVAITGEATTRRGTVQIGGDIATGPINGIGYYKTTTNSYEVAASPTSGPNKIYRNNAGTWSLLGTQTFGSGLVEIVQGGVSGGPATVGDDKLYACGDGTDIFRWDGAAWVNMSSPETAFSGPRNASIVRWHTARLVAAGSAIKTRTADPTSVPDAVYFSDLLDPTHWGTTCYDTQIRVGGGDGAEIVALCPWTDFRLATFKRNSTWVIDCDPTFVVSDMPIQLVHGSVGCIARRTPAQVGSDILFLAQDGVRSLQQTVASDQKHELGVPLSFPIQDYINRINWSAASGACGTFWNNLYLLSAPLDSSTTNNYLFVFNSVTSTWSGYWTNLPVSCFSVRKTAQQSLMMGLGTVPKVIEFLDYVHEADATDVTYTDWNGNAVLWRNKTRALTFGDPKANKKGLDYEVECFNSKGNLTITPILDEDASGTPDSLSLQGSGFVIPFQIPFFISVAGLQRQPFDLMRRKTFRELQFDITTSVVGRKQLRQITAQAFPEAGNRLIPQPLNV